MAPVMYVAVAPTVAASIPSLFRSDDVRSVIENPPVTRTDGFNILTYERAEIVEGERLVIDAGRTRLELFKDASFVAIGTFIELLGWPRDGASFIRNPKVNPLALIEFTYDFFKTYESILDFVDPLPIPLRCEIGVRGAHFDDQKLWMAPYGLNTMGFEHPRERHEAPEDSVTREIVVEASADKPHIQPGQIAYALVEELYNWFGLDSTTIPYVSAQIREVAPQTF